MIRSLRAFGGPSTASLGLPSAGLLVQGAFLVQMRTQELRFDAVMKPLLEGITAAHGAPLVTRGPRRARGGKFKTNLSRQTGSSWLRAPRSATFYLRSGISSGKLDQTVPSLPHVRPDLAGPGREAAD